MKTKKGISLIVLVITIIVMIILAAAIIITLSNSGIISKANEAVQAANLQQVNHIATLAWSDAYAAGKRTQEDLKTEVYGALNGSDIDISNYIIAVTEAGVTVTLRNVEKNEYGFFFEVPYIGTTADGVELAIIMLENGEAVVYADGVMYDYFAQDSLTYKEQEIVLSSTVTVDVIENGTQIVLPIGLIGNTAEIICTLSDYQPVAPYYNKPYEVQITVDETTITYGCVFDDSGAVAFYEDGVATTINNLEQSTFTYVLTFDKNQITLPQNVFETDESVTLVITTKEGNGPQFEATYYLDTDNTVSYIFHENGTATNSGSTSEATYTYEPYFVYQDDELFGVLSYNGKYILKSDGTKYTGKVLTEVDIVAKQTLTFADYSNWNVYAGTCNIDEELEIGETYIVEWDGQEYTCTCKTATASSSGIESIVFYTTLGDISVIPILTVTSPASGEPFFISYYEGKLTLYVNDTATTHTVRIYQTKLM